jgi:hypothetical protein
MPIRKTPSGWFWGNKGPYPTKQKAIDVGRAAYASGYKENQMNDNAIKTFASTMLHSITCAHILHLQTTSYAAHIALNEYYEQVEDLIDAWIEAFQGKYGIIDKYDNTFEQHDNALDYMGGMIDWLKGIRPALPQDTELQNIVDEIAALIDSTVYKLRRFS